MAMPLPTELHDVNARAAEPVSGARPRVAPASAPRSPDEEAMLLMMKVMQRARVATSFAKIAAGLLTVSAARATTQLRAAADARMTEAIEREGGLRTRFERVRKIARAATEAAVQVAKNRHGDDGSVAPPSDEPQREQPKDEETGEHAPASAASGGRRQRAGAKRPGMVAPQPGQAPSTR